MGLTLSEVSAKIAAELAVSNQTFFFHNYSISAPLGFDDIFDTDVSGN